MCSRFSKKNKIESSSEKMSVENEKKTALKFDTLYTDGSDSEASSSHIEVSEENISERNLQNQQNMTKNVSSINVELKNQELNHLSIRMPFKPYEYQKESIEKILWALHTGQKNIMFESPTGTGKTQTILTSLLSHIEYQAKIGKMNKKPKVLFFTRTVTQMNQIIREVKQTSYNVKATILASRNYLCLNEEVMKSESGTSKKILCSQKIKDKSCQFKSNYFSEGKNSKEPREFIGNEISDIEDLRKMGTKCQVCPYYYSKSIVNSCDVIVLSYNYLIERECRSIIFNLIKDNYIVFDEAHNLVKLLEESNSWELNFSEFRSFKNDFVSLKKALQKKGLQEDEVFEEKYEEFKILMDDIQNSLYMMIENTKPNEFQSGDTIIDLFYLKRFNELEFLSGLTRLMESVNINVSLAKFIKIYSDLLGLMKKDPELLKGFQLSISNNKVISFICMESSIKFNEIIDFSPKLIMLISGTLSPFENIENQLKTRFDGKISVSPDSSRWKLKLSTTIMSSFFEFNNFKSISLNFKNRAEIETLVSFFAMFRELLSIVPEGLLVFLPSYQVLDEYKTFLNRDQVNFHKMESMKNIYFESKFRDSSEIFLKYKKSCRSKGAVFFLVFGGKFSEGLDFKDELARLVIIMGIPFGNIMDTKIQAKKEYLKNAKKDVNGFGHQSFKSWYTNEAFSLVNQASGRVKRNENDFGYIMLIDERFEEDDNKSMLSEQIKKMCVTYKDFKEMKRDLNRFFERNMQENYERTSAIRSQIEQITSKVEIEETINQKRVKEEMITTLADQHFGEQCMICYEKSVDFLISKCNHIACRDCWTNSLQFKLECMMCKSRTRMQNLMPYLQDGRENKEPFGMIN